MSAGIAVVVVLAVLAAAWIVTPLWRRGASDAERIARSGDTGVELQSRREMILATLRDLEEDHATDKIDEADYGALRDRLTAEAVDIMKRLDALGGGESGKGPSPA